MAKKTVKPKAIFKGKTLFLNKKKTHNTGSVITQYEMTHENIKNNTT